MSTVNVTPQSAQFGLIGRGAMGENLASTLFASATTGRITGDARETVAAIHDASGARWSAPTRRE